VITTAGFRRGTEGAAPVNGGEEAGLRRRLISLQREAAGGRGGMRPVVAVHSGGG
jgi:hypothetical protein